MTTARNDEGTKAALAELRADIAERRRELASIRAELNELKAEEETVRMPELTDEERDRLFDRISLWPNTELIWAVLTVHKLVEGWVAPGVEGLVTRDALLIGEVIRRLDQDACNRAFAIYFDETDEGPRFPDLESLGLDDERAA